MLIVTAILLLLLLLLLRRQFIFKIRKFSGLYTYSFGDVFHDTDFEERVFFKAFCYLVVK